MADDPPTEVLDPRTLVKGSYTMIKGNPAWITDIVAKVKGTGV